jgi:hypothetical protein
MSNLVYLQPFCIIIKKMKPAAGMLPVPEKIKTGRNSHTGGYFRNNNRTHPSRNVPVAPWQKSGLCLSAHEFK